MNTAKLYSKAVGKESEELPDDTEDMPIALELGEKEKEAWLNNKVTVQFFQTLTNTYETLVARAISHAGIGQNEEAARTLVKAQQIKEVIKYGSRE